MRRILLEQIEGGVFVTKKAFVFYADGKIVEDVEYSNMAKALITIEDFAEGAKKHGQ
jgi:hypothetical protein